MILKLKEDRLREFFPLGTVGSLSESDGMLMATGFLSVSAAWCVEATPSSITALYCRPPVCSHLEPGHSSSTVPPLLSPAASVFTVDHGFRSQLNCSNTAWIFIVFTHSTANTRENLFKIACRTFNHLFNRSISQHALIPFGQIILLASCREKRCETNAYNLGHTSSSHMVFILFMVPMDPEIVPYYTVGEKQYAEGALCPNSQCSSNSRWEIPGWPSATAEILQ